jgi:hypothetical protein
MQNRLAGAYSAPVANALLDRLMPPAAAPVARREFPVSGPYVPAGQASVGMPSREFPLTTPSPARAMLGDAATIASGVAEMFTPPSPEQYLALQQGYSLPRGAEVRLFDDGPYRRSDSGEWVAVERAGALERLTGLFPLTMGGRSGTLGAGFTPRGTRYVRANNNPSSPMNEVPYAMFKETRDPRAAFDDLSNYGRVNWVTRGDGAVDVRDLQPAMVRALRSAGHHEQAGTTAAALAREAAPARIVDSAGLWDNPRLVQTIWDEILEPRGVSAVRTPDGLILFDPAQARRVR